jgi:hypothetical protein
LQPETSNRDNRNRLQSVQEGHVTHAQASQQDSSFTSSRSFASQ